METIIEPIISDSHIESSPYFLSSIFILAIITFIFIYFMQKSNIENAKELKDEINDKLEEIKVWLSNKIDSFFAFLHLKDEMIKKVIT